MSALDLSGDIEQLTLDLVDVFSESGQEAELAGLIWAALKQVSHLELIRDGDSIVARTHLGRAERVVIAGHLDTVPEAGNLPGRIIDGRLYGLGACDMKGGVAVALRLAATVPEPVRDVTYFFYEAEEVESARNGLGRLARTRPELLAGAVAILLEPSDAGVEAGCQGTLRAEIVVGGRRAHSGRGWLGQNAIQAAAPVLVRLTEFGHPIVEVDGLAYREGMNAVGISGGVAGNVVPDQCVVTVNHRFAPSLSAEQASQRVREMFAEYEVTIVDVVGGALPGLTARGVQDLLAVAGTAPRPKFGWTDVARFAELGIPALNMGPGDPNLAHTREEHVDLAQLHSVSDALAAWLRG